jgi:hypothetical protein
VKKRKRRGRRLCRGALRRDRTIQQTKVDRGETMSGSDNPCAFEERHFTISELAQTWHFSEEFVRQIVQDEPGVTEWVRQQPGKRRYRVLRVPQSVAERLYRRAQARADHEPVQPRVARRRRRGAISLPLSKVRTAPTSAGSCSTTKPSATTSASSKSGIEAGRQRRMTRSSTTVTTRQILETKILAKA